MELPELREARLKVKAMRAFVRDLDASLARAEEALQQLNNAQPKEAQRVNSSSNGTRVRAAA